MLENIQVTTVTCNGLPNKVVFYHFVYLLLVLTSGFQRIQMFSGVEAL